MVREPTIGLDYTESRFDNAAALGLTNGSTLRARGGATFGTLVAVNDSVALQPTLGLFAFSNLEVDNGSGLSIDFNRIQAIQTDEGKVRGEVQASLTAIFASGLSAFVRAETRFGDDLIGAAGRVGFRYQF